jgi:hypothetical protein
MNIKKTGAVLLPLVVFTWLAVYVLTAVINVPMGPKVSLLFALAIGPLGMVGCLELGRFLDPRSSTLPARAGIAFGVCAFAIMEAVMVIQKGAGGLLKALSRQEIFEQLPEQKASLWLAWQSANAVQASMDIAFDIFYCLALLLFSILMLEDRRFGRLIGGFGIFTSTALLILNFWTFPIPPAEAGLIDVGPLTGLWWIVVIVLWIRADRAEVGTAGAGASGS